MRIKEVCEKTGLTDRAVRLYIDEGLLTPNEEVSYAGRRSLIFSEEDVAVLSAIAALRRADFSLADIGAMQKSPEQIGEILTAHRTRVEEDIAARQKILTALNGIDDPASLDYRGVADAIEQSASGKIYPKEDSSMGLKDVSRIIRRRIPSLLALLFLLIGMGWLFPCIIRALFATTEIHMGGGFDYLYHFSLAAVGRGWPLILAALALVGGAVMSFGHLLTGKKPYLLAGGGLLLLAAVLLLTLPAELGEKLFYYEFLRYRFSLLWDLIGGNSGGMDVWIRSVKFLPMAASLVCLGAALGYSRETM